MIDIDEDLRRRARELADRAEEEIRALVTGYELRHGPIGAVPIVCVFWSDPDVLEDLGSETR